MVTRGRAELEELARLDLAAAVQRLGLELANGYLSGPGTEGGQRIDVIPVAYLTAERADGIVSSVSPDGHPVVVADRTTEGGRARLCAANWSYYDRAGRLRLRVASLYIDVPLAPAPASQKVPGDPLGSAAAQAMALEMLTYKLGPAGPSALARAAGISQSTASVVLSRLKEAGLAEGNGRGVTPELFWELAARWSVRERAELSEIPDRDPIVLTGDLAAADMGAGLLAGSELRPEFYVADASRLRLIVARHPQASGAPSCAVSVAPVPRAAAAWVRPDGSQGVFTMEGQQDTLIAHPVVVALDLARDPGRGREVLSAWEPPPGVTRVW